LPTQGERGGAPRERVLSAAMDLFGRQGYRATTVAQIEEAAGLSPGSGGLYRHFPSKRALLEDGLRRQSDPAGDLGILLAGAAAARGGSLTDRLTAVAVAGLRRLDQERDLNRLLMRDLAAFPDLLAMVRDRELRRVHRAFTAWLRSEARDDGADLEAVAAVLMGAISHYWIMSDIFSGAYPLAVAEDRYVAAAVGMAARLLGGPV
jgi:AcrR family transcriptional regulator